MAPSWEISHAEEEQINFWHHPCEIKKKYNNEWILKVTHRYRQAGGYKWVGRRDNMGVGGEGLWQDYMVCMHLENWKHPQDVRNCCQLSDVHLLSSIEGMAGSRESRALGDSVPRGKIIMAKESLRSQEAKCHHMHSLCKLAGGASKKKHPDASVNYEVSKKCSEVEDHVC